MQACQEFHNQVRAKCEFPRGLPGAGRSVPWEGLVQNYKGLQRRQREEHALNVCRHIEEPNHHDEFEWLQQKSSFNRPKISIATKSTFDKKSSLHPLFTVSYIVSPPHPSILEYFDLLYIFNLVNHLKCKEKLENETVYEDSVQI